MIQKLNLKALTVVLLLAAATALTSAETSDKRPAYEHSWEGAYIKKEGNFAYFDVKSEDEPLDLYLGPLAADYRFAKGKKYRLYCDFFVLEDPETLTAYETERLLYAEPL